MNVTGRKERIANRQNKSRPTPFFFFLLFCLATFNAFTIYNHAILTILTYMKAFDQVFSTFTISRVNGGELELRCSAVGSVFLYRRQGLTSTRPSSHLLWTSPRALVLAIPCCVPFNRSPGWFLQIPSSCKGRSPLSRTLHVLPFNGFLPPIDGPNEDFPAPPRDPLLRLFSFSRLLVEAICFRLFPSFLSWGAISLLVWPSIDPTLRTW